MIVAIGILAGAAGCTPGSPISPAHTSTSSPDAPSLGPLGGAKCTPASPIRLGGSFPEVQGTPTRGDTSLYGWIMAEAPAIRTGNDLKIVWRMVGEGDLRVTLLAPDGTQHSLSWGPEEHGGSNYIRPGREWGTGLVFDATGCWELQFATDTRAASVWFEPTV
ncbi:hypothetical protein BH11ACT4_BH11ACT4_11400 [soil metagenome]